MSLLMVLAVLLPLLLVLTLREANARRMVWLLVLAPLPMLLLVTLALTVPEKVGSDTTFLSPSVLVPEISVTDPNLLLGLQWRVHGPFLGLMAATALLWLLAGLYSWWDIRRNPGAAHVARYLRCWLLTMGGNFGVLLAADIASFYSFFALMTFAAYGLVIHLQTPAALRAGKVYIAMAVLGEGLLLSGLLWGAALVTDSVAPMLAELPLAIASSSEGVWVAALLFAGFGVKAGLAGLHWWLPLAHPVAPAPASAVLSGAMIKAGLVGWILTLPLGEFAVRSISDQALAWVAICLGLLAAYGAALLGVMAAKAKTVLAYSSVSQMGMITCMLGVGWLYPAAWPAVLAAILVFASHHGLNKGLLFFAAGLRHSVGAAVLPWVLVIAVVAALNLIGVPFSSGAYGKDLFKAVLTELPQPLLYALFSYGALATTALMLRFGYLLRS